MEEKESSGKEGKEINMGSLQLAAALTKQEPPKVKKGQLFTSVKVDEHELKVLVAGASNNFMRLEEANRLEIKYKRTLTWMKAVNSKSSMVHGIAREVSVKIGEWQGNLDFSIVPMDDYACVLSMEFLDDVQAILMPFANSMCIMERGNVCIVALIRGRSAMPVHFQQCSWPKE